MMKFRIKVKMELTVEGHAIPVHHVMMKFGIKEKMTLTAEDPVMPVIFAITVLRTQMKMRLIVEDYVLPVQLAEMGFRIKMKMELIAEEKDVLLAVRAQYHPYRNFFCSFQIDYFDLNSNNSQQFILETAIVKQLS